jgi:acyl-coenzyme A synthetase/AMP-(fatty) acid ligase
VRDAVVIGRDDDVLGAVPVAYVVTDAGDADRLVRELTQRCLEVLPRTHRPAAIQVVPSLPVGPTGKTVRRLVAAQDAAGRAAARS